MVPDGGVRFIDLIVVEKVVVAGGPVEETAGLRNPVDGGTDAILGGHVGVDASVVLGLCGVTLSLGLVVDDIRNAVQAISHAGICRADPAEVLIPQATG